MKTEHIARSITSKYITAISIIACVIMGGYAYMQYHLNLNHGYAEIINKSGKQRMLSQRIAFLANSIAAAPSSQKAQRDARAMQEAVNIMHANHAFLIKQTQLSDEKSADTKALNTLYYEAPHYLDTSVNDYINTANRFLQHYSNTKTTGLANSESLISLNAQAPTALLSALDKAVTHYQKTAENSLDRFKTIETIVVAVALFILWLEIIFIFKPLVRHITNQMKELSTAKKKAEELNNLKSDFLATMSHEIRTPMNAVLGMAELIRDATKSKDIKNYAETILSSGDALLNIIGDILDFSKMEAYKLEIEEMPVNMLELCDEIGMLYSVRARSKAIELAVRYKPGSEQFVYADPVRIRQILSNLVTNAIKFTEKGHVTLLIEEDFAATCAEGEVCMNFIVKDTGIGMSEDACVSVFEKFTQADSSTTRQYGGTGLGLSICKNLVTLMKGSIAASSTLGEGSTFKVSIPFRRDDKEVFIQPKPPILSGIRVLVIDDIPVIRKIVSEQLTAAHMVCDTADGAKDALNKMQEAYQNNQPYQIAILDYLMPDMNGEMLASAIYDHPELRSTCLVMLTAAGNPMADSEFVKKGFSAYIAKPVQHATLIHCLATIWERYSGGETSTLIHTDYSSQMPRDTQKPTLLPNTHVLVAEDNLVNQMFIKEILEEMQCHYTIVSNGNEAVNAVKTKHYHLVLMDCLMPEMDGFEATKEICRLKALGVVNASLPILALTANATKEDRQKCLDAGMDEHLSKPIRKKTLQDAVVKWSSEESHKESVTNAHKHTSPSSAQPPLTITQKPATIQHEASLDPSQAPNANDTQSFTLLDAEAVEQARAILKTKYDEMVDVYIANCKERIEEMQHAIASNDNETVIRASHTLKSTSAQMGALELSLKAKQAEAEAKAHAGSPHAANIGQTIHALQETLELTAKAFKQS